MITCATIVHKSGRYQIFPVEVTESHVQSLTHQVMVHVTRHVHRTCLVIRPLSCEIIRKVTCVTETVEETQLLFTQNISPFLIG